MPVTAADGAPSSAFSLVAITCTVYSVPAASDPIVYSVVSPGTSAVAKSWSSADLHCTW